MDGSSGIRVKSSSNITIRDMEIYGPALKINGTEASNNRERVTGRGTDGKGTGACGQYSQTECSNVDSCNWSSYQDYCIGETAGFYAGVCVGIADSTDILVEGNNVHHCTSAGIRCDRCDNV